MPTQFTNDIDFVPAAPKRTAPCKPVPAPWQLPKFSPFKPTLHEGSPNLPPSIDRGNPIDIFDIFITPEIIEQLIVFTNRNAELNPPVVEGLKGHKQSWRPCVQQELYAYIGVTLCFGLHQEADREAYWNTNERLGPLYTRIRGAISRDRFSIIDRFFYLGPPLHRKPHPSTDPPIDPPTDPPINPSIDPPKNKNKRKRQPDIQIHEDGVEFEHRNPFEKIKWFSDHCRIQSNKYWQCGTHITVDESIVRFLGRASEIVNIPTKPTPEGFKIWILANQGYVVNWMYHAKGEGIDKGPFELDIEYWCIKLGFSKTQAVVLELVSELLEATPSTSSTSEYIVWMDNLFTSVKLLTQLKKLGVGAAGTVRTTNTKRELLEQGFTSGEADAVFEAGDSQLSLMDSSMDRSIDIKLSSVSALRYFYY